MTSMKSEWKKVSDLRAMNGQAVSVFYSGVRDEFKVRAYSVSDDRFEESTMKPVEKFNPDGGAFGLSEKNAAQIGDAVQKLILKLK